MTVTYPSQVPPSATPSRVGAFWRGLRTFFRRAPLSAFWGCIAAAIVVMAVAAPLIAPHEPLKSDFRRMQKRLDAIGIRKDDGDFGALASQRVDDHPDGQHQGDDRDEPDARDSSLRMDFGLGVSHCRPPIGPRSSAGRRTPRRAS